MNVPALSERTLRKDIEKSDFSSGPKFQVGMAACPKYTLLKTSCLQTTCMYICELYSTCSVSTSLSVLAYYTSWTFFSPRFSLRVQKSSITRLQGRAWVWGYIFLLCVNNFCFVTFYCVDFRHILLCGLSLSQKQKQRIWWCIWFQETVVTLGMLTSWVQWITVMPIVRGMGIGFFGVGNFPSKFLWIGHFSCEVLNMLFQYTYALSPRLSAQLLWSRFINEHGQSGKTIKAFFKWYCTWLHSESLA